MHYGGSIKGEGGQGWAVPKGGGQNESNDRRTHRKLTTSTTRRGPTYVAPATNMAGTGDLRPFNGNEPYDRFRPIHVTTNENTPSSFVRFR
jgi:hypothetical protein